MLCHTTTPCQSSLRLHGAAAHCVRLAICRRCGLSFLSAKELKRHPCEAARREREEEQRQRREEKEREERQKVVPPLVVRPNKVSGGEGAL